MHKTNLTAAAIVGSLALLVSACNKPAEPSEKPAQADQSSALETTDQKASYIIGHNVGSNIVNQGGVKIDTDAFVEGMQDGLAGEPRKFDVDTVRAVMGEVEERAQAERKAEAAKNLEAAKAFLEKNGKREGVITTESGLQYEVLTKGFGMKPALANKVEVHYHGTLMDGTVFDSSVERGETIEFPVSGVIKGWTEALQLMPIGSKWRLYIPPNLAYGERKTGKIPPNSLLIFDVELIAIKEP